MIRIFTGYDHRESVGWHAFAQSVIEHSGEPVANVPLGAQATERDGSNAFTYSRFLVPYLCDFTGWAIFADGADMLLRADLDELWELRRGGSAVMVAKHDYRTRHPRKYIGTSLETANEDYPRKNWSSLVLWNCEHEANGCLLPEFVQAQAGSFLHRFSWLPDGLIGELPLEWNWLADEYGENEKAKLLHWTAGQPGFYHYKNAPHAPQWRQSVRNVLRGMD